MHYTYWIVVVFVCVSLSVCVRLCVCVCVVICLIHTKFSHLHIVHLLNLNLHWKTY